MLTEEARQGSVDATRLAEHEEAAHDKRNWVRLTYECNDRCIFCLDSDTHDGEMRDPEEVKAQILDGRRKGATRLILSGGEPTIHPRFVDFVKLGRLAGYTKVQTVTNGRMFRYREFITRAIDAGLGEITFSIHGPNARVHDALVGVKGAFDEEVEGLRHALADGRVIVNIDVCVNRGNVKVLPEIIETFVAMGVREYDLLHVIPFGRAWREGQHTLFYDLEEAGSSLREAFAHSRKPGMHIWLNRFPPEHCEGFEDLIQDPYKLNDEVRGRKEEYEGLLTRGEPLDCREPKRCSYCYLRRLCDTLDDVRETVHEERFDAVRIDVGWEATLGPVYGGDPASARRMRAQAAAQAAQDASDAQAAQDASDAQGAQGAQDGARVRLPVVTNATPLPIVSPVERARSAGAALLEVVAPDLASALAAAEPYSSATHLELDLEDVTGVTDRLGSFDVARVIARDVARAEALLALPETFEVVVLLTRDTADWVLALDPVPERLVVRQPTYQRLSTAGDQDADLPAFFAALDPRVPVEDVPPCIAGRSPRPRPRTLDTSMLRPDGQLEVFRYAKRFILDRYYVKSLRCKECRDESTCRGLHINQVRAHGFAWMTPIVD